MTLTAWQHEQRTKYLTASRVPAVLGLDPWKNAADVLASYTMDVEEAGAGEAAEIGLGIEPMLIDWCASECNLTDVRRNQWRVAKNGVMAATLDAVAKNGVPVAIEAKTAGILHPAGVSDEWGEPGTDKVPVRHLVQIAAQMIAEPDVARVYVPALIGGRGRMLYVIERGGPVMTELLEYVEENATRWWEKHVVQRDPLPADLPPASMETLKRIRRDAGTVIDLSGNAEASEIVATWQRAVEARKAAEEAEETAKARAVSLVGADESAIVMLDGQARLLKCAKQSFGKRVDGTALKRDLPDVFDKYAKESTGVVPRLVKPK